jgi:sulfur carrier protein ThiS
VNITVNGKVRKLNIGCRTFISVAELLNVLEVTRNQPVTISLNGKIIHWQNEAGTAVSNGDAVAITSIPMQTDLKA